jgi:hypothetical protein
MNLYALATPFSAAGLSTLSALHYGTAFNCSPSMVLRLLDINATVRAEIF